MENTVELLHLSRDKLIFFATSILKNNEDAQDVVQEVFSECFEKGIDKVNLPYLFKAVRNRSLNKIRAYNRFVNAVERFADYVGLHDLEEDSQINIMDYIEKLPLKQREVLALRIKAELKISEISHILGIPEGTVKSRLNKSLKTLRNNIQGI